MTRIIKVEFCDRCPNHLHGCGEPLRCRAAEEEVDGYRISRRFRATDPYPFIPAWCPLEQTAPDLRPPERQPFRGDRG